MSDPQWLWNPLFVCQMGPLQEEKTCCGITKKGDACKLIVKKETLKEGRQKLSNLARSPFDLSNTGLSAERHCLLFPLQEMASKPSAERCQTAVVQRSRA